MIPEAVDLEVLRRLEAEAWTRRVATEAAFALRELHDITLRSDASSHRGSDSHVVTLCGRTRGIYTLALRNPHAPGERVVLSSLSRAPCHVVELVVEHNRLTLRWQVRVETTSNMEVSARSLHPFGMPYSLDFLRPLDLEAPFLDAVRNYPGLRERCGQLRAAITTARSEIVELEGQQARLIAMCEDLP